MSEENGASCVPKQETTKRLIPNFVQCPLYFMCPSCHCLSVNVVWRARDISDEAYKRGDCSRGGEGAACMGGQDQAVKELGRLCIERKTTCSDRTGAVGETQRRFFFSSRPLVLDFIFSTTN